MEGESSRSTRYPDGLRDSSVSILRYYEDVYVKTFFPHTTRPVI